VGLAAPQVGVNVQLMVFNCAGERGKGEEMVLANPRIISTNTQQELDEEGCLSFRGKGLTVLGDVQVC
jgi:peptide deformylase